MFVLIDETSRCTLAQYWIFGRFVVSPVAWRDVVIPPVLKKPAQRSAEYETVPMLARLVPRCHTLKAEFMTGLLALNVGT
jgi:hypothetical protein